MNELEEVIALRLTTLRSKFQAYKPEDINEFNVDEKVYLRKLMRL